MPFEKSRIIKARSPPSRILEILSFSKFNREDNFFADNQVHICGRYGKRNRKVSDEFYTLYAELVQQEKRNHWKETRRHISLDYLNENGIDFESPAADLLCRTA